MREHTMKQHSFFSFSPSLICWVCWANKASQTNQTSQTNQASQINQTSQTNQGTGGNKRNQNGFSLVELLIVVVIIGILATVGVPRYNNFKAKAKRSEAKSLLTTMYTAQTVFFSEWNQYYGDFNAIGYGLEGDIGWFLIFNTSGAIAGPPTHPSILYRNRPPVINSSTLFCNQPDMECTDSKSNFATYSNPTVGTLQLTFTFQAFANLDDDPAYDVWQIDHSRSVVLQADDIRKISP